MRKLILLFLISIFGVLIYSGPVLANGYDDGKESDGDRCSFTVFLKDWKGGFRDPTDAFDFCFDQTVNWGLDTGPGWKDRYCHLSQHYNRDGGYYYFDMLFFHRDREYRGRYSSSNFLVFERDYSYRVHTGFNARIEIVFSKACNIKNY